jgi:hypothetical protein
MKKGISPFVEDLIAFSPPLITPRVHLPIKFISKNMTITSKKIIYQVTCHNMPQHTISGTLLNDVVGPEWGFFFPIIAMGSPLPYAIDKCTNGFGTSG